MLTAVIIKIAIIGVLTRIVLINKDIHETRYSTISDNNINSNHSDNNITTNNNGTSNNVNNINIHLKFKILLVIFRNRNNWSSNFEA
jgi:hypothetical protein